MEKEKITIELPSAIVSWYRMKAEHNEKALEQQIADELIEDAVADLNNKEYVAEVVGTRVIIDANIDEALRELGHSIYWLEREREGKAE